MNLSRLRDISFHLFLNGVRVSDALYLLAASDDGVKFATLLLVKCKKNLVPASASRRPVPEAVARREVHLGQEESLLLRLFLCVTLVEVRSGERLHVLGTRLRAFFVHPSRHEVQFQVGLLLLAATRPFICSDRVPVR